ncbi:MAG: hypothetical protein KKG43_02940 [Candidatus Omnitrophica bacterium]|nr:hypothetical protein [Candidatus Omnitrophota bacterium]
MIIKTPAFNSRVNTLRKLSIILSLLFLVPAYLFAEESGIRDRLKEQSRIYRQQGMELQKRDDYSGANMFYQKAVELDPGYAAVYNDLGVMSEAEGFIDRAEQFYLMALKLDPKYLSPYSNLALIYEEKRDLPRAGFYWKKRWELGLESDPWTNKAKSRFFDLMLVAPAIKQAYIDEETLRLNKDAAAYLKIKKEEEKLDYQKFLKSANNLYRSGDYNKALEEVNKAQEISNSAEVIELRRSIIKKITEKEKNLKIKEMEEHFKKGVTYYQYDNPQVAQEEFNKIKALATSPQKR